MRRLLQKLATGLAALGLVVFAGLGPALAEDANTRVIVPDAPGGALVAGCYQAPGNIYQKYRFQFCLEQRGTYRVTGGGVRCSGTVNWDVRKAQISVRLRQAKCGNGVAWSADTMSCRSNGLIGAIIGMIVKPGQGPRLGSLKCDYTPVRGSGQRPISFIARRVS